VNIDYARIIERANKRKDCLLELEEKFKRAGEMAWKAEEARDYAKELAEIYKNLDDEGRTLLPISVRNAMGYMVVVKERLGDGACLSVSGTPDVSGLRRLAEITGNV
jgi:hypothetical protein